MISHYGIWGAAVVWFGRQVIDSIILYIMARKLLNNKFSFMQRITIPVSVALLYLFLIAFLLDPHLKGLLVVLPLITSAPIIWYLVLTKEERIAVWSYVKMLG